MKNKEKPPEQTGVYFSYMTVCEGGFDAVIRRIARFYLGFMVGNNNTSLIEKLSVRNITRRSTPMPMPPVGGMPYSRAVMKSSS